MSGATRYLDSDWYFSREEIEEKSPSRKDGVDFKKETELRNLYCSFLKDLGMKLKVPQITIATATMFCHRFYLHQSHAKNEWQTIATACMFLAAKVEETPRTLRDVVIVAYETMYGKNIAAAQRIKHKEIYEKQKDLILVAERLLLVTIGFDLNIHLPYKPLIEALKKLNIAAQNEVARVAWNFVNDWLRTTLCLQYKPHYIAAGSLYLAAWFHKVKLPSKKGMVWWQLFDVTPKMLEEVIRDMFELLQQNEKVEALCTREKVTEPCGMPERIPSSSDPAMSSKPGFLLEKGMGRCDSVDGNDITHDKINVAREGKLQPQVSDCGSTLSHYDHVQGSDDYDRDKERKKSNELLHTRTDSVSESFNKIDVDRIKATVKKRSWDKAVKADETKNDVKGGDDDWIERELEHGIVLDDGTMKQQRCV